MKHSVVAIIAIAFLLLPPFLVDRWASQAAERLETASAEESDEPQVGIASAANAQYCTPRLRKVLRRVLQSCGLVGAAAGRGCQPADVKSVATMSGSDFNELFLPMQKRGGIVQYEKGSGELDAPDGTMINDLFADRRGASYFFVVSRASPEGNPESNRELSRERAESVLTHLQAKFNDPDLASRVGLLWLGEEFAQLDPSFCDWKRSGEDSACATEDLNRSAFITWIDCTL